MSVSRISVVICTHNRAADALQCIEALCRQVDFNASEIILVDSASNAGEQAVLSAAVERIPDIAYIRLEEPGLSIARNKGIAASSGEWVAFVDDDAVAFDDWYANLVATIDKIENDCAAIGGRIVPIFPEGEAPLIGPRWKTYVSINDKTGSRDCTETFELIAANCCFRREALLRVGGFPVELGRLKGSLLSGEDVLVMRKLRQLGWRIWFDGSFCVGHKVPRERLTRRWVRSRAYWEGITTVRAANLLAEGNLFKLVMKAFIAAPILGILAVVMPARAEWDLRFWFDYGVVVESLRSRRKASAA